MGLRAALSLTLVFAGCATSSASPTERPADVPLELACQRSEDCVVVPRTRCGQCGAATLADARAHARAVPVTYEGPEQGCPDCYQPPDPRLFAYCRQGRCEMTSTSALSPCASDDECVLVHAGCCECGSPGYVGMRRDGVDAYRQLECGPAMTRNACPACALAPPSGVHAACVEGHCERVPD